MSLRELALIGWGGFAVQAGLIAWRFPSLAGWFLLPTAFALLMRYEFFVPEWLKRNWWVYVVSHALVVPLIDFFASSLDWGLSNTGMPAGMWAFYGVIAGQRNSAGSRQEAARPGTGSPWRTDVQRPVWSATGSADLAGVPCPEYSAGRTGGNGCQSAGLDVAGPAADSGLPQQVLVSGIASPPPRPAAKAVETAAGLWTLLAYLTLGGLPMLL